MSLIWWGTELVDFELLTLNNGVAMPGLQSTGNNHRKLFTRGGIELQAGGSLASPVISPALTSFWLKFVYGMNQQPYTSYQPSIIKNGTNACGLRITSTGDNTIGLYKYDGTTLTKLIQGVKQFYSWNQYIHAVVDLCVTNYHDTVNGNAKLYLDGELQGEFTGDLTVLGQTSLDQFYVVNTTAIYDFFISEVIIADEDTRMMFVKSHYPVANGDVNQWNGDYTKIDEGAYNDADVINIDVVEQDAQFNVVDVPAGDLLSIEGIKIAYRGFNGNGSNIGHQVGIKTNGVIHLNGVTQDLPSFPQNTFTFFSQNPETLNNFTIDELNAAQIVFRSKSK